MFQSRVCQMLAWFVIMITVAGCAVDESAMMCVDQAPGTVSVAVSNHCNKAIVVVTDDGEKLIIGSGLTHQLLGVGNQLGACFSPKEPKIAGKGFRCE